MATHVATMEVPPISLIMSQVFPLSEKVGIIHVSERVYLVSNCRAPSCTASVKETNSIEFYEKGMKHSHKECEHVSEASCLCGFVKTSARPNAIREAPKDKWHWLPIKPPSAFYRIESGGRSPTPLGFTNEQQLYAQKEKNPQKQCFNYSFDQSPGAWQPDRWGLDGTPLFSESPDRVNTLDSFKSKF